MKSEKAKQYLKNNREEVEIKGTSMERRYQNLQRLYHLPN